MICNQCNNKVPDDSEYCQFCGNIIDNKTVESTTVSDVEKGYTYLELKEWKKAKEIFDFAILNNDNKSKAYIGRLLAKLKLSDLSCLSSINKSLTKFDDFNLANKYADEDYKNLLDKCYSLVEEKIKKKKVKSKKIALISSISFMSIIIVSTLSYFVFIPWGRFFYYEKLLSNGNVKKAINSFSNSKFYEYDEKAIELFYNKGVSLVENKDYKNAEICFNNTKDFKDSNNYSIYCKGKNLLEENDLESYNYFTKCKDFLDSENILKTNEFFIIIKKLQGKWSHPELKPYANRDASNIKQGSHYRVFSATNSLTIKSESISISGINVSGQYTKGKLVITSNNQIAIDDDTHKKIRIETDSIIYIEHDFVKEIKWEKK